MVPIVGCQKKVRREQQILIRPCQSGLGFVFLMSRVSWFWSLCMLQQLIEATASPVDTITHRSMIFPFPFHSAEIIEAAYDNTYGTCLKQFCFFAIPSFRVLPCFLVLYFSVYFLSCSVSCLRVQSFCILLSYSRRHTVNRNSPN